MLEPLWVAQLLISDETRQKLASKHTLEAEDVRKSLVCVPGLLCEWHTDHRGTRALAEIELPIRTGRFHRKRRRRILIVLYPVKHPLGDVYALGSAYPR